MGRSSVSGLSITVFGATGFIGRYLVNRLGQCGHQVIIPYRGEEYDVMHLRQMGDRFHLSDQGSIERAVKDSNIVINLIGQDRNSFNFTMDHVNVYGPQKIANACQNHQRFIHLSNIMANLNSKSEFLRTKALGEQILKQQFPSSIIVRPSVVFGHEDRFISAIGLFADMPIGFPVIDNGNQLRFPLYVGDVAEGLLRLVQINKDNEDKIMGKTFDFYGPNPMRMHEFIKLFAQMTMRPSRIINLPPWLLWLYARIFPEWKRPLYTIDAIKILSEDEVPSSNHKTLADLGLYKLHSIEEIGMPILRGFRHPEDFGKPWDPKIIRQQIKQ